MNSWHNFRCWMSYFLNFSTFPLISGQFSKILADVSLTGKLCPQMEVFRKVWSAKNIAIVNTYTFLTWKNELLTRFAMFVCPIHNNIPTFPHFFGDFVCFWECFAENPLYIGEKKPKSPKKVRTRWVNRLLSTEMNSWCHLRLFYDILVFIFRLFITFFRLFGQNLPVFDDFAVLVKGVKMTKIQNLWRSKFSRFRRDMNF